MSTVENRLMEPFYLSMMGLNAPRTASTLWDDLTREGRTVTVTEVTQLLAPDRWRPVVMGSWFSVKFESVQVGQDILSAIERCRGSLTAPPLSVAAAVVVGEAAAPVLADYIERDVARDLGSASSVAAVVEHLGVAAPVQPDESDRIEMAKMLGVAERLRAALVEGD